LPNTTKKKVELDRKLQSETSRSREENNKTVTDLEQIIEAERKRCQDAIDHVRKTLNAKIRVLELQLQDERENDSTFKKDKRKLDQELQEAYVQLEEHMARSARDARRVESLERQITLNKERHDKVLFERNNLETMKYSLERTRETVKAQLDAAKLVNDKLNSEVPPDQKILLDDLDKMIKESTLSKAGTTASAASGATSKTEAIGAASTGSVYVADS